MRYVEIVLELIKLNNLKLIINTSK